MAIRYGKSMTQYYTRNRTVTRLVESPTENLNAILRSAIHKYGEDFRSSKLPENSPEKLNLKNLFSTFSLAKESLKNKDERVVLEDLIHGLSTIDKDDYLVGIISQVESTLDALPVKGEEPDPVPDAEPQLPDAQPQEDGDIDFGVSEVGSEDGPAPEPAFQGGGDEIPDDDVSDEEFKGLVAKLGK